MEEHDEGDSLGAEVGLELEQDKDEEDEDGDAQADSDTEEEEEEEEDKKEEDEKEEEEKKNGDVESVEMTDLVEEDEGTLVQELVECSPEILTRLGDIVAAATGSTAFGEAVKTKVGQGKPPVELENVWLAGRKFPLFSRSSYLDALGSVYFGTTKSVVHEVYEWVLTVRNVVNAKSPVVTQYDTKATSG